MDQASENRQLLISYILGTMPEPDRLALAERCFADDDLFEELLTVETDLLDQYVRGRLDPQDQDRFKQYLHRLPDPQHRIGVATALAKVASERQPSLSEAARVSSRRFVFKPASKTQALIVWSLAAALIIAVVSVIWLASYSQQLEKENARLRAKAVELTSEQQRLEQAIKAFEDQNADNQAQLEQLQKVLDDEQLRRRTATQVRLNGAPSPIVSLDLTAASRDLSIPDMLHLTRGTELVLLRVPIRDRDTYTHYRAVVQTTEGKLVWEKQSNQAPSVRKEIVLQMSARQLPPAGYKLTLVLKTSDGIEIARDYYFTVTKR